MPDIFLSYNREDQAIAERFAQGFAGHGLDVWWDTTLRAGDAYDEVTERALREARAVVVLWSPRSVASRWVRAEATIAARQKTLVPCMIEPCERPIMFELTHTADLSHWTGTAEDPAWRSFVGDVTRFIGTPAIPAAQPETTAAPTISLTPTPVFAPANAGAMATAPQERRHVTLLSARLAHGASIDPEEWHALVTASQAAIAPVLARFGGTARWRGDTLTAIFGYPVAHEDAAQRAVHAGLAIAAVAPVCAGIHAGTVLIAPGPDGEIELFGDAPDIAASARATAPPGAVVVTSVLHTLIGAGFDTEPHGAPPAALVRILRPAAVSAAPNRGTRFVGREDEAYLLGSRWRRVQGGEGQHLLIKGEPGIGKTRLTQEFRTRIAADEHLWIDWAGASLFANTPFHAIIQGLSRLLEAQGGDRYTALLALLAPTPIAAETAPLVAEMMGIALPADQQRLSLAPGEQRRRLLAAMAEWVFALTRRQPVVIAIDDLQWIDPSTMELVQILVEQGATAPLMLIGTARPEFRPPWPERAHHAQITLGRLGNADIRQLVADASRNLDASIVDAVMSRADGVPLFAEELTRLLADGGAAAAVDIPATLRDSLAARLDRLGPAKDIAQLAAVLGREFSYELLHAVAGIDDAGLAASLSALADAELIHARGLPPRATYQFKHALVQDSAYEALTRSRRRALHAHVAATIVERFPALAAASPELLASHWSRAGEVAPAVAAWHAAGTAAYARRAFKEAEACYREALAMLATSPDSPARDASELDLYSALNRVLQLTHGYAAPETAAAATRAKALAEKTGNLTQLIREEARIWRGIATSGDYAAAAALADHILDLCAGEGETPGRLFFAYNAQLQTRYYTGDLVTAERYFRLIEPIIAKVGDRQAPGNINLVYGIGALTAWKRGDGRAAAARIDAAHAVAARSGNPYDAAMALHFHSNVAVHNRDLDAVDDVARRLSTLSEANGFAYLAIFAASKCDWVRAQRDPDPDCAARMKAAAAELTGTGARVALVTVLNRIAEVEGWLGDSVAALATLDTALTINPQERVYRPETQEIRGSLRLAAGDFDAALADFRDAITAGQSIGAHAFVLRAAHQAARIEARNADTAGACRTLTAALAPFEAANDGHGLDVPGVVEARAELTSLGGTAA